MPIIALSSLLSRFSSPQQILILVLVLTISLSFHEFAHGYVAYRLGDDTAAMAGRLTMNPLAHLDPIGTLMFLLVGIGYAKPVPINPARFSHARTMKKGIMLTSLAGPAANFILSFVSALILYSIMTLFALADTSASNPMYTLLSGLFSQLYITNIWLMVFNLLPVPPLDGYKIFGSLLPNNLYYKIMSYERYIGMAFLMLVLFGRGLIASVLSLIAVPFNYVIDKPLSLLFNALWRLLGLVG